MCDLYILFIDFYFKRTYKCLFVHNAPNGHFHSRTRLKPLLRLHKYLATGSVLKYYMRWMTNRKKQANKQISPNTISIPNMLLIITFDIKIMQKWLDLFVSVQIHKITVSVNKAGFVIVFFTKQDAFDMITPQKLHLSTWFIVMNKLRTTKPLTLRRRYSIKHKVQKYI